MDRLTRFIHWLYLVFETSRRSSDAEPSTRAYYHGAAIHRHARDGGDKGGNVSSAGADPNPGRLASNTSVADIDIVTASGEIKAGVNTQCNVAAAGRVVEERIDTGSRVAAAGGVAKECPKTVGRVV